VNIADDPKAIAVGAAAVIAGVGFAAAQIWGEGAGMPIVIAGSSIWVAWFVRWQGRVQRP
jgi:hypothetical protein